MESSMDNCIDKYRISIDKRYPSLPQNRSQNPMRVPLREHLLRAPKTLNTPLTVGLLQSCVPYYSVCTFISSLVLVD